MTRTRSIFRGVGGYLPRRVMTNAEISTLVDTSDEWIVQRTGIHQRYIAAEGETTSDLAVAAARRALADADLGVADIDLIIVATTTPAYTYPATAALVQDKLGMRHGTAFDIQAVCSGFVFAVATADSFLKNGLAKRALVIGAETNSRILDWTDRGLLATALRTDGSHWSKLYVDGGPSTTQTVGHVRMEGREVFKHAVGMITDVVEEVFEKSGYTVDDLDWFVPHQANKRIIDGAGHKLGVPPEKVIVTVDRHANTSAASVPLALAEGVVDRRIKHGDLVMLEAMGAGFTWGASLIRW